MLNRRCLLLGLTSLFGFGLRNQTGARSTNIRAGGDSSCTLDELLVDLFDHLQEVRVVGQRFLELHKNESCLSCLMSRIFQEPVARNQHSLRRYLDSRRTHDFESGNVVELDGWLLSATEARVFAVAAHARTDSR